MTPTQAEANVNAKLRELAALRIKPTGLPVRVHELLPWPITYPACDIHTREECSALSDRETHAMLMPDSLFVSQHLYDLLTKQGVDTTTFAEGGFVKGPNVDTDQILP